MTNLLPLLYALLAALTGFAAEGAAPVREVAVAAARAEGDAAQVARLMAPSHRAPHLSALHAASHRHILREGMAAAAPPPAASAPLPAHERPARRRE